MSLLVPISVGELLDKISILEIKAAAITDPAKLANVRHELAALEAVRGREVAALPELPALYAELKAVNEELWRIEDEIREKERDARFDTGFVELARSVYRNNDRRALVKRRIKRCDRLRIRRREVVRLKCDPLGLVANPTRRIPGESRDPSTGGLKVALWIPASAGKVTLWVVGRR